MKGTIRFFTGFIITFIVGCSIDSDMTTKEMLILTLLAIVGLASAYSGVNAMNKQMFKEW